MKTSIGLLGLVSALFLASCASSLEERITENQASFDVLTPQQKELVAQGKIAEGMPPSAVKIVWGDPISTSSGMLNGKYSERWIYPSSGGSGFSVGVDGGVGNFGSSSGYGMGSGVSFPINYVPPNTAYVLFVQGKVVSWEGNGRY